MSWGRIKTEAGNHSRGKKTARWCARAYAKMAARLRRRSIDKEEEEEALEEEEAWVTLSQKSLAQWADENPYDGE